MEQQENALLLLHWQKTRALLSELSEMLYLDGHGAEAGKVDLALSQLKAIMKEKYGFN